MDTIETVLTVIGAISVVFTVIRIIWVFFITNIEWVNNVTITQLPIDDPLIHTTSGDCIFPQTYIIDSNPYSFNYLIRPNDVIIKKIKLYKIEYSNCYSKSRSKCIKVFHDVSPYYPLVIQVSIESIIPNYYIRWSGEYGVKTEYVFQNNGRDGNVNSYGKSCKIGFVQRIRRVLGLK